MTIEATAEALATGEAQVAEQVAQEAPQEVSELDELSSVWDAAQSDDKPKEPEAEQPEEAEAVEATDSEADAENEADAADEKPEEAEGDTAEDVEVPTDLPKSVRDVWKEMPETARAAFLESHRKMGRQLAEQGRMVQGIKPIQDVLVQAVKDLPALANMQPAQVAQEVMALAKISNDFEAQPVETILGLIKQKGLEEPLRKIFAGEQPGQASMQNSELQKQVRDLQRQLSQVSSPDYLREQVTQITSQTQVEQSVTQFAQNAEHWNVVEEHMPNAIQFIKASAPDASPSDVLARAYELAVSQIVPEASKATHQGTAEQKAIPAADPEKTQAARKAKSVNVKSTSTGQRRQLSEDEQLARVWDKAMNA